MKKLLVLLLVLGMAAPAMAGDFHFYGSARMMLGYTVVDKDFAPAFAIPQQNAENSIAPFATTDGKKNGDQGTILTQSDGQARFGAYAKASDTVTGQYEVGYNEQRYGESTTVKYGAMETRLLYGQWKFGPGNLRVGQDYTPATFLLYSNMAGDMGFGGDEIMLTTAIPYISRRPQLKLTLGGFQVALIEHNLSVNGPFTPLLVTSTNVVAGPAAYTTDADFQLPRIELAYQFNTPVVSLRPILGYQSYTMHNAADNDSVDITSYLVGLGVKLRFGPAYVNVSGAYCVNPANYGLLMPLDNSVKFAALNKDGDGIEDAASIQALLVAGFKINPMLGIEAGFGYMNGKVKQAVAGDSYDFSQTALLYYIQAPITLAPGVSITPEFGKLDLGNVDTNDLTALNVQKGSEAYFVCKFQIDF